MSLKKSRGKGKIKWIWKRGWGGRLGFGRRQPRGSFQALAAVVVRLMGSRAKQLLGWRGGVMVSRTKIHNLRGFRAISGGGRRGGASGARSWGGKCPLPIVTDTMVEELEDVGAGLGGSAGSRLLGERAAARPL